MTETMLENRIELKHISAGFDGTVVFSDVSLTLPISGCIVLQGPSGCGKTTLLRVLAGLIEPKEGELLGLENRRVSFVFQEDRLLPWYSAKENIMLVSDENTAEYMLAAVGLADEAGKLPAELSGGMRRRVAIARALAYSQDVLLLDEPFNGLDPALRVKMAALIKEHAKLIVLVTHDREDIDLFDPTCTLRFVPDGNIETDWHQTPQ